MSTPQKSYRICAFDAQQRALRAELIEAASDAEAIAIAEESDFGTTCEIWEGTRLVTRFEAHRRMA